MYKLKDISIDNLIDKGFKNVGDDTFVLHFPIYWWNHTPTSFCDAIIHPSESKRITLNVYHANGQLHEQWYTNNYKQAAPLLKKINNEIDKRMHKIGARHYEDR